jgi:hypothetical protein
MIVTLSLHHHAFGLANLEAGQALSAFRKYRKLQGVAHARAVLTFIDCCQQRYLESAMSMDHRWGRRRPTDVAVRVIAKWGAHGTGRLADVSLTGANLETQMVLRDLAFVYLESADRNLADGTGKRIAASVVRHDARGVGLEWCEPRTKAAGVNALLAMLGGAAVDEMVGVYDRHYYSPENGNERAAQSAWTSNS